jgi:hypothetical protein
MTTKTVCASGERLLRGSWVPSAPRLFDNGVEGNDQLYSPFFETLRFCEDLWCMRAGVSRLCRAMKYMHVCCT